MLVYFSPVTVTCFSFVVAVAVCGETGEVAYMHHNASYKKKPLWVFRNYGYIKNVERGEKLYLKCRMYKKCRAAAVLNQARRTFVAHNVHTCMNPDPPLALSLK